MYIPVCDIFSEYQPQTHTQGRHMLTTYTNTTMSGLLLNCPIQIQNDVYLDKNVQYSYAA